MREINHLWRAFRAADGGSYWKCINCGARGNEPLSLDGEQRCSAPVEPRDRWVTEINLITHGDGDAEEMLRALEAFPWMESFVIPTRAKGDE